jgi:hypothetical protein
MRLATLVVVGLAFSLPAAAVAEEHRCGCCGKSAHSDHAAAVPSDYEFQYEGLVDGVIYSVMRHPGMDVQMTIGVGEKSFDVIVAPMDWLDAQHIVFRPGEKIEIVGARGDRGSSNTIVAREIHTTEDTIVLRDNQGRPLWK